VIHFDRYFNASHPVEMKWVHWYLNRSCLNHLELHSHVSFNPVSFEHLLNLLDTFVMEVPNEVSGHRDDHHLVIIIHLGVEVYYPDALELQGRNFHGDRLVSHT